MAVIFEAIDTRIILIAPFDFDFARARTHSLSRPLEFIASYSHLQPNRSRALRMAHVRAFATWITSGIFGETLPM